MNTHQFFLVLTVLLLKVRIKTSTRSLFSFVIPLCLFLNLRWVSFSCSSDAIAAGPDLSLQ